MEVQSLLSSLDTQKLTFNSIKELEKFVGPEDKTTLLILEKLLTLPHKPSFLLKIGTLILLENIDLKLSLLFLIQVFENCSFSEKIRFLNETVKSKYYILRLSVPYLIRMFWFDKIEFCELFDCVSKNQPIYLAWKEKDATELSEIVKLLLKDQIDHVIKTTILCLTENLLNILNRKEIEEIIENLQHHSLSLQSLVVNLSLLIKKDDFPLENWKLRINYAKLCYLFDNPRVFLLSKDVIEEVRIAFAINLPKLKHDEELIQILLKDSNSIVKAKTIEYLCLSDREVPNEIINECWEVKLAFLQNIKSLKNFDLVINTINSLKDHKNWRVRKTVLLACNKILLKNQQFIENDFFKKIKEILLTFLFDKVSEIRNLVSEFILNYKLEEDFIKKVLLNRKFKHRKGILKYCVKNKLIFAIKKFSLDITEIKKELIEEIKKIEINNEIYNILEEMMNCEDKEIQQKISEIIKE